MMLNSHIKHYQIHSGCSFPKQDVLDGEHLWPIYGNKHTKNDFEIMMVVIVSNLARCEWYIGAIGGLAAPDKQGAGLIRQLRWCLLVVEGSRQAL